MPPTWLSVLAWIYLVAFGFRLLADLSQGTIEYNPLLVTLSLGSRTPVEFPVWWALIHLGAEVCFGIGCVALLLGDRDLVWFAIIAGWAIGILQCCDAFIGIFHLQFGVPLSAPVYIVVSWRAASLLRVEPPVPPRSLGTI